MAFKKLTGDPNLSLTEEVALKPAKFIMTEERMKQLEKEYEEAQNAKFEDNEDEDFD